MEKDGESVKPQASNGFIQVAFDNVDVTVYSQNGSKEAHSLSNIITQQ